MIMTLSAGHYCTVLSSKEDITGYNLKGQEGNVIQDVACMFVDVVTKQGKTICAIWILANKYEFELLCVDSYYWCAIHERKGSVRKSFVQNGRFLKTWSRNFVFHPALGKFKMVKFSRVMVARNWRVETGSRLPTYYM